MELAFKLPGFINIPGLIEKALSRIFDKRKPDVDPDLMEITYTALDTAIDKGFGKIEFGQPNFEFAEQLRGSAALFAAKKSWAQAKELANLAIKENGHQRSWAEFKKLAEPIVQDYNINWLETEFKTAVNAARGAKQWKQYEENMDLFPNLKYTPSLAATPSEEHKVFYGVTLPITHAWWIKHYPPSRWRCQCGAKQSRDAVTVDIPTGPKPAKGLDNNPGITGKLFSDSHPYNDGITGNEKQEINEKAKNYVATRTKNSSGKS